MKHMPMTRSVYSYQTHPRLQITNSIRKDLREKLKNYSVNEIHNPESKIYDCMLEYFLLDEEHKEILTKMVRNYY